MLKTHKTVDLETGEETIIELEETAKEKADRIQGEKELAERLAAADKAAADKAALLAKLGITADEAALLLG
jgi:predicted DNA-binding antitoxin AbrB/MazE fold protein